MTNLWDCPPGVRRLIQILKQTFRPNVEAQFQKYDVTSRPGAEILRRRLLLRSQVNGAESLPPANRLTRPEPAPNRSRRHWPHGPDL